MKLIFFIVLLLDRVKTKEVARQTFFILFNLRFNTRDFLFDLSVYY
jgi:hypothetical protein